MTSSMSTGERRWASARRGGMTVLGKVAVPKPINLPSQRLENHGLDPNVEIVPKGTLGWGSRPSSAGSNAWGSSALSPSTDGSSSSSSQLVGRPSSGGGTRPSTAGSERAHDSNVNAWSSNSRPSSASGVLASNNSSLASVRPRSADTRPGSSQLSRFAEPSPETSGAWGSSATSERIGVANSGKDGFSLTSGDFPTLGSEKDESRKNTEPLDCASHRHPESSSGVTTTADNTGIAHGDDASRNADFKGNSWRKSGPPYVEDGPRPSVERWQGDPHPYQNPSMAPHYDTWHGAPPVNARGGVRYRGPPPYGAPTAPGGFLLEPFPYYRPHVPAPGLANSQPIPPPRGGPPGHHPKNGDMYRPHLPDSYMRPGMPIRPGFYPGPVPYEGYYGPPMRFCNPNDRDVPFMGMAAGPPVFNRPVDPNAPDPNNSHPRLGDGRGAEQAKPVHPHDSRGNYKVLTKQNDGSNQNDEDKWSHTGTPNREKGILSKASDRKNASGDDHRKDEHMHYGWTGPELAPQSFEHNFGSTTNPPNLKFPGSVSNMEDTDRNPVMDNVTTPKDLSLMQKIESLNAKARASGGRQDGLHQEEAHDRSPVVSTKANRSANDTNSDVVLERHYPTGVLVPVSHDMSIPTQYSSTDTAVSSITAALRRPTRGVQSRGDHPGEGSLNGLGADGTRKKVESHTASAAGLGSNINEQVEVQHAFVHAAEGAKPNVEQKGDGESVMSTFDPSDTQRAKMKEIAKQRAMQLQKEEEERIREQKAKALAKLEELNRRSANQGTDDPGHKVESLPSNCAAPQKHEDPKHKPEPSLDANRSTGSSTSSSNFIAQTNEGSGRTAMDSTVSSIRRGAETNKPPIQDSAWLQNQLPTADVNFNDAAGHRTAPQVREAHKQKRLGQKQRQNVPSEKSSTQDSVPPGRRDAEKDHKDTGAPEEVSGNEIASGAGRELAESALVSESAVHQKKKNNKSGKKKHRVDESSATVSSSVVVPQDSNLAQAMHDNLQDNGSDLKNISFSIQSSAESKDVVQSSENHLSSHEDAHSRLNNTWKPQNSRKPRSSQGNRSSEKSHGSDSVVWAPVRSHNNVEATDQTSQKAAEPSASSATVDNVVVNNISKTKRAEMERYVPKPVAKELAQQGSVQQSPSPSPSPSIGQVPTDGTGGRMKASQGSENAAKIGSIVESKHLDGKHRQRAQGSWRQRASPESVHVQDGSSSAGGKNVQASNESSQTMKSDESLVGGPPSKPNMPLAKGPQANVSDGWNSVNDSGSTLSAASGDHFPSGRVKRHPFKGHKSSGNNQSLDQKDKNAGLTDMQCLPVETSQTDKTVPLKENKAVGDRTMSHWQPKSQGHVAHNLQGNRSRGGQNFIAEDSKAVKREIGHNGDSQVSSQNSQFATRGLNPLSASENKYVGGGMPSLGPHEKREKKTAPVKERPQSPNHGPIVKLETAPFGAADGRSEQRPSSGYRKSANLGGHFSRGHESHGDWNSTAPEKKQHYSSANRERQRQNAHYEYQPVGPYNGGCRSDDPAAQTENQPGGPRFHERGQNYPRRGRGNFYGRQSDHPTDAVYE